MVGLVTWSGALVRCWTLFSRPRAMYQGGIGSCHRPLEVVNNIRNPKTGKNAATEGVTRGGIQESLAGLRAAAGAARGGVTTVFAASLAAPNTYKT